MDQHFQLDRDLKIGPTDATQTGDNRWLVSVTISDQWQVIVGPNGGYLSALLLAGVKMVNQQALHSVRSVTVNFISASVPGPAQLSIQCIKQGRTLSLFQAMLYQGDRDIAQATVTLASDRLPISFCDINLPEIPHADTLQPMDWINTDSDFAVPFRAHYDQRVGLGPTPFEKDDSGRIGGWMRFKDLRPVDDLGLLAMSDGWYPSIITRNLPQTVHFPSLDHTVHFLCSDFSSFGLETFIGFEFTTEVAATGYLIEDGKMFSETGQLLAISRQMAAMVPLEN